MTAPMNVHDDASVFPAVSPGMGGGWRRRHGTDGSCQTRTTPRAGALTPGLPQGLALDPIEPERTTTQW